MPRTRTTKTLAQRIDLNYFKRPTPLKRAKFWLSVFAPALALLWIVWHIASHDSRVYSSGRLSEPHAVLEKECAACHVRQAGYFSASVSDAACLACHEGPMHHAGTTSMLGCAECHIEHRGRINISAASNQACASCHDELKKINGSTQFASHIASFEKGHPEFAALRPVAGIPASDPGSIKLNHAVHMKPIRRGPSGPVVQLECGNCHRPASVDADLTYSDPAYHAATVGYRDSDEFLSIPSDLLRPPKPASGRELMAPVKFANACAGCHALTFDKRFGEGVPHDKPEVIHGLLVKRFGAYIAAHPAELREVQDPGRELTGQPHLPRLRTLMPAQWVAEKVAIAEELLWRKTCAQCHSITSTPLPDTRMARWAPSGAAPALSNEASVSTASISSAGVAVSTSSLPSIALANIKVLWLPHARFDHDAHRGFACVGCHQEALTSTESKDILIPGIAICQKCHAPGPDHAESRCFECHTYHDWSKRKEVKPTFVLPALHSSAR